MSSKLQEFMGTVRYVRYARDGFLVATVHEKDESGREVTVAGSADHSEIQRDITYRFLGCWKQHPAHGLQFKFSTFTRDVPHSRAGILDYLTRNCRGIGAQRAAHLWDQYGPQAVEVLLQDPERVAREGVLSADLAREACVKLKTDIDLQKTKIDLYTLFHGRGLPASAALLCIGEWGAKAPEVIRRNPYALLMAGIPGCGFRRVDRLYRDLGLPLDAEDRQVYCALHAVYSVSGHTWVQADVVAGKINENLGEYADPPRAIQRSLERKVLIARQVGNQEWLTTQHRYQDEKDVQLCLQDLLAWPGDHLKWPDPWDLPGLSEHQREQLLQAFVSPVALLIGSPGTGKTYCLAAVVGNLVQRFGVANVGVCCPTGKAAVRVTESLQAAGIGGVQASTIHALLGIRPARRGYEFTYHEDQRLPYEIILVDELSMVNLSVMAALVRACSAGTHLFLVGDPYQLPPVDHGAPLRDFLLAGMPRGELTEIHRNAGLIIESCKAIKDREPYQTCAIYNKDRGQNLKLVPCTTPEEMIAQLRVYLHHWVQKKEQGTPTFDPVTDIHVLALLNEGSLVAQKELNRIVQEEVNPDGQTAERNPFRVGDKILCRRNSWQYLVAWNGTPLPPSTCPADYDWVTVPVGEDHSERQRIYLANGDIGQVLAVEPGKIVATFGNRWVRLNVSAPSAEEDEATEGDSDFTLGYATTVHKYQGSEIRCVLFLADPCHRANYVASAELVYTAFSRAKELCIILGSKKTLDLWTKRWTTYDRKTFLKELIQEILRPS
jgi:exodeoxyribonuclease V alpha subunit